MFAMSSQSLNGSICKLLPTQCGVTIRLMGSYRQRSIQQQHALLCPTGQIARGGNRCTKIGLNLLEDILQRGRELDTILHGETQSVRLSWLMIRILSDNHHLHLIKRTQVEGIENQFTWRITGGRLILLSHS